MATPGGQSYTGASDGPDGYPKVNQDALFEDLPKEMLRLFKEVESYVSRISKEWGKTVKETTDAVKGVEGNKTGSGRLGLGSMSRNEKIGVGLGLAAVAAQTYMSMAPNTMTAVTQRMAADSYAAMSGMSSRQAILQANRQVGGGATSAFGPTMAAMNLAYSGYTANSLSSKNIMGQIAGLSAQSGMTNEAAASSVAGMNGMMFLRAGIRIRDNNGNLKPIDQIINQVYNFLYRGRQVTSEEAQLVYQPNSRAYNTIAQLAGGDPNLIQQIQAGIVARTRAKSAGAYSSAMNSKDPNKMLDLMGVDKSSPLRSNFRFQSSENKKLAATEQGLVGGYNVGLRTTAALNDGFSAMAGLLGPINDGLMTLKGILQTMPAAGNMGASVTGLVSSGLSLATSGIQAKSLGALFGKGAPAASAEAAMMGPMTEAETLAAEAGAAKGVGLAGRLAPMASRLTGALRFGGAMRFGGIALAGSIGKSVLDATVGKHVNSKVKKVGDRLATMGIDAAAGAAIGSILPGPGTAIGAVLGTLWGAIHGGPNDHGNLGTSTGASGDASASAIHSPAPTGTKITSGYGNRGGGSKTKGFHPGIDFDRTYQPVYAAADGVVSLIGNEASGYGNWIEIKHATGKATRYGHLKTIKVSRGQHVKAGEEIAISGNTGKSTAPHLHFEVLVNGQKVDPTAYLQGNASANSKSSNSKVNNTPSLSKFLSTPSKGRQKVQPISPSGLSSTSLTALLAETSSSGAPLAWQDVLKKLPKKEAQKYIDSIPDSYTGPVTSDKKTLIKTIAQQGFHDKALRTAYAISIAESGGRSNAVGDVGLQDSKWGPSIGLFQIRSLKHWKEYNDPYRDASRLPDPSYNAQAAWAKSSRGRSFKAWSTYTSGSFLKHLSEADAMAKQTGVGGPSANVNLPSNFSPVAGMNNQSITISGGRSGGGHVNVNLHMNVTISHGSVQEADRLVHLIGEKLKNDHTLKQIASTL